jgi:hypothetical protein
MYRWLRTFLGFDEIERQVTVLVFKILSDENERASAVESAMLSERAIQFEDTMSIERAMLDESTKPSERASGRRAPNTLSAMSKMILIAFGLGFGFALIHSANVYPRCCAPLAQYSKR